MYNIYVLFSLLLCHLAFHRWILPSFSHRIPPRNWQINPKITSCMERVLIQPPRNTFFFFFFFFSFNPWLVQRQTERLSFVQRKVNYVETKCARLANYWFPRCSVSSLPRSRIVIALSLDFFVRYALLDFLFRFFFFFFNFVRSISNIYLRSLSYVYDFLKTKGKL